MNIQKVFAANMRRLRKEQKLTQEQLAEKCGLHRTYIGGIEQARVNVSLINIGKIANSLNVNPALLFAGPSTCAEREGSEDKNRVTNQEFTNKGNDPEKSVSHYYLGMQKDGDFTLDPIEVDDPDLAVQILVGLIQEGYSGNDLAKRYIDTKRELLNSFHKEHRNK